MDPRCSMFRWIRLAWNAHFVSAKMVSLEKFIRTPFARASYSHRYGAFFAKQLLGAFPQPRMPIARYKR